MQSFIKNIFSSALGVLLAFGLLILIGVIFILGVASSRESQTTSIKKNSILYIPLSGIMQEQANPDALTKMLNIRQTESIGLNEICQAIQKAKDMKEIKGIYIETGALQTDPASLEEIRTYLADFKKSGKFIITYGDMYSQGMYYLCSVADKVMLNPSGTVDWKGLAAQPMFYKDMLEKFGVKMQVFKVGTFKSAVEPFTNTQMSDANRLQVTAFLGSIWQNWVNKVSDSRHISKDTLQSMADHFLAFAPAKDLVKYHMIDTLTYIDGAKQALKKYVGIDQDDKLNMVSPSDVCGTDNSSTNSNKQVAVYYCAGDIVNIEPTDFSNSAIICAPTVIKDLQDLGDNDDVKAVVLRINSGGGDAYASEQIWHAIKELGKKKPVIVSMGGLAASGAYYMSSASSYIFAEPTTLTGSIGIFGMFPDMSGLLKDKLGLKFDGVRTNRMSDLGTISRPFNAEEGRLIQGYIERGYALFVDRVGKGRKKTAKQVDEIGQGRVWTGEQAIKNNLVDKLGNLDDAVKFAAQKAKLGKDYAAVDYPTPEPWYLNIINQEKDNYYETKMRATLGEYYRPFMFLKTLTSRSYIQAHISFDPNIN